MTVQNELNAMVQRDEQVLAKLQMAGDKKPIRIPLLSDTLHDLDGLKYLGESLI